MTEPVVVGVDGSGRSLRALIWAAQEAASRGRALHIVHVLPPAHEYATTPAGHAWELGQRDKGVVAEATTIAKEAHPGLEVTSALPSGAPAAVLLSESEHAPALVVGAKGMGGFGSLLLGSVALQVVGHAACPVVVVNHLSTGHHRIVVGTDGSAHSHAALAYAFEQASLRRVPLVAVHAWTRPGLHGLAVGDALDEEVLECAVDVRPGHCPVLPRASASRPTAAVPGRLCSPAWHVPGRDVNRTGVCGVGGRPPRGIRCPWTPPST
ncbi:universal stress protein [Streptomyces sp. GS7]|uniref:universal stress protein n=1 Tax=Streptomyces sp. GS7 TaxID=2692234 RepID=UPI001318CE88|nr:universal stress protein [Streptomyces sp. GS7]QHC23024.1 universal stress protein [Streptomyces sp. GS7]